MLSVPGIVAQCVDFLVLIVILPPLGKGIGSECGIGMNDRQDGLREDHVGFVNVEAEASLLVCRVCRSHHTIFLLFVLPLPTVAGNMMATTVATGLFGFGRVACGLCAITGVGSIR